MYVSIGAEYRPRRQRLLYSALDKVSRGWGLQAQILVNPISQTQTRYASNCTLTYRLYDLRAYCVLTTLNFSYGLLVFNVELKGLFSLCAQEYGRRLHSIGIKAEELPAYILLWQCVAPEADRQGPIVL